MKNAWKEFGKGFRSTFLAGLVILGGAWFYAKAQQPGFNLLNAIFTGHYINGGSGGSAVPTYTNCAAVGTPSDTDGACTTSNTSGAIIFATPYATAPYCVVTDASSTTVPPTYTTTTTQITLTTIINAHVINWHCGSRIGG
jgi:hypothetical protein